VAGVFRLEPGRQRWPSIQVDPDHPIAMRARITHNDNCSVHNT
jgi:hypothetical protein